MLNNKGQSLVMFVILMPIILLSLGLGIEVALISYNKIKISSVTKSILANCIDRCEKNDIIELYNKNDIMIDNLQIDISDGMKISGETKFKSFIAEIIGIEEHTMKIELRGYLNNNKIYYEKG